MGPADLDWRSRLPGRAILDAFDVAGLAWSPEHAPDGVMYCGRTRTVHLGGCDDWSGAHELAHWLLASPERRGIDDYGGGKGEHSRRGAEVVLEEREAAEDEQLAQALTVAILVALGLEGAGLRRYGTMHMGTLPADWRELRRRGLLTEGNVPIVLGQPDRVLAVPGPQGPTWNPPHPLPWWDRV